MASNKGTSTLFKVVMSFLVLVSIGMLFYACKREQKQLKDVTTKVVAKEVISSRVVRDNVVSNKDENGPVTIELNLKNVSFDLKNSK
jgi:hypothetical protein